MVKLNHNGFSAVYLLLWLGIFICIGYVGYLVYSNTNNGGKSNRGDSSHTSNSESAEIEKGSNAILWSYDGDEWSASGDPPICPDPMPFGLPSDIGSATGALWPGQERGGDYKAHGGVRYDDSDGKIDVRAPMEGILYRAAHYVQAESNEPQYMIDVINNCGISYRMDHLRKLSPRIAGILESLGGPKESSATSNVDPTFVEKGDLLATEIGFSDIENFFYDLGVYDLRQKNESSQNEAWASNYNPEYIHYGICWFDLLPEEASQTLQDLPAGKEGKDSDYCK